MAAVTQSFIFTTNASLGVMAKKLARDYSVSPEVLGAFQTAYRVIGDDPDSRAPALGQAAPAGPDGIHYLWWAGTIQAPVGAAPPVEEVESSGLAADSAPARLLNAINTMATEPLGAAVQLRWPRPSPSTSRSRSGGCTRRSVSPELRCSRKQPTTQGSMPLPAAPTQRHVAARTHMKNQDRQVAPQWTPAAAPAPGVSLRR